MIPRPNLGGDSNISSALVHLANVYSPFPNKEATMLIYALPKERISCIKGWRWWKSAPILTKISSQSYYIGYQGVQKLFMSLLSCHESLHHNMFWRLCIKNSLKHRAKRRRRLNFLSVPSGDANLLMPRNNQPPITATFAPPKARPWAQVVQIWG